MLTIPWHPFIVHFPLALSVILPFVVSVTLACIYRRWLPFKVWFLVFGLQLGASVSGYLAMESGESDEKAVAQLVGKKVVHEHEERAEIFVSVSVATTAVSLVTLLVAEQAKTILMIVTLLLTLLQGAMGTRTGLSGGELVYLHKAPLAFKTQLNQAQDGYRPLTLEVPAEEVPAGVDDNEYDESESTEEPEETGE